MFKVNLNPRHMQKDKDTEFNVTWAEFCWRRRKRGRVVLPSYSLHTDGWGCTHGCRHETGDPPSHVHVRTHTIAARFALYRCAIVKSTRPPVPAALAACSPIWALTCSSPADKRIHFLPCLLQRLLLLWEPQYSTERNYISQGLRKARVGPCGRYRTEKLHTRCSGKLLRVSVTINKK